MLLQQETPIAFPFSFCNETFPSKSVSSEREKSLSQSTDEGKAFLGLLLFRRLCRDGTNWFVLCFPCCFLDYVGSKSKNEPVCSVAENVSWKKENQALVRSDYIIDSGKNQVEAKKSKCLFLNGRPPQERNVSVCSDSIRFHLVLSPILSHYMGLNGGLLRAIHQIFPFVGFDLPRRH